MTLRSMTDLLRRSAKQTGRPGIPLHIIANVAKCTLLGLLFLKETLQVAQQHRTTGNS